VFELGLVLLGLAGTAFFARIALRPEKDQRRTLNVTTALLGGLAVLLFVFALARALSGRDDEDAAAPRVTVTRLFEPFFWNEPVGWDLSFRFHSLVAGDCNSASGLQTEIRVYHCEGSGSGRPFQEYWPCLEVPPGDTVLDRNAVYCFTTPWHRVAILFRFVSLEISPVTTLEPGSLGGDPWAITLRDGRRCVWSVVPSAQLRYDCPDGSIVHGPIDRTSKVWMAFVLDDTESPQTKPAAIDAAWFFESNYVVPQPTT
jgi:hypothetical protein